MSKISGLIFILLVETPVLKGDKDRIVFEFIVVN